ncbi:MAG: hypothetical protein JOZ47_17665 [Kutzneria sp.]|nr:hypothetical protein [Kutzneria sp.]
MGFLDTVGNLVRRTVGGAGIGDYRFEGYTNEQLADQVSKLSQGTGATALHTVVDTLNDIAKDLTNTNTILRTELAKIGVDWQSVAGEDATDAMTSSATYTDGAEYHITDSSGALITQSDSQLVAAGAPRPSSDTQRTFADNAAGFFGHETDHARQVEKANEDRQKAIDQLNAYQSNSQNALNSCRPLPEPPGLSLQTQPASTAVADYASGPGALAGSAGGAGGVGGATFATPGVGTPGPGYVPPAVGSGPPVAPLPPGAQISLAPGPGGGAPSAGLAGAANGLLAEEIGLGAAVAGGAGAVAAGANSGGSTAVVRGGSAERGVPSRASSGLGAPDEERAAQARAAERISPQAKQGAPMMQPAADRKKKEDDAEHVRKYAIEADDLFGDQRMVAPTVIGEDPSA